ncbi:MAG TPA: GyrI-like domain-containing protein [Verrucomicrobiae bacterium]|nr:GyrI-like domain-containing protein [Verrucomicrobiae bacterium]
MIDARPRPLAVVRVTTVLANWPREFVEHLNKVYTAIKGGRVRLHGQNVMVYHPRHDGQVDIECGVETDGPFDAAGDVVYSQTPAGRAVTVVHIGPYSLLGKSHGAIAEWSRAHGHMLDGTCWEIYGDWEEDPARLRTDIFHLTRR